MNLLNDLINVPIVQGLRCELFTTKNIQADILRLDLLHPIISGNKYLKLIPWLQMASKQGKKHIVTTGGPWSNHVHAAAYACHLQQLSFTAIIKGTASVSNHMLNDILRWDGNIIYCHQSQYLDDDRWQLWAHQHQAFYIPMGGEGQPAITSVTNYFNTLVLDAYDVVICPVGTATTYAGIAFSNLIFKKLIGINPGINDKNYQTILSNLAFKFPHQSFEIVSNAALKKFGKWPVELPMKMNEWIKKWQLPTDLIYTAKMMWTFEEMVTANSFEPNNKILLVHTGGLQGNRSMGITERPAES